MKLSWFSAAFWQWEGAKPHRLFMGDCDAGMIRLMQPKQNPERSSHFSDHLLRPRLRPFFNVLSAALRSLFTSVTVDTAGA